MVASRPLLFRTPRTSQNEVGYLTITRDAFFPANVVTFNADQHVGVGWDGVIGDTKVEIKDDKKSANTGNLFIETRQCFPGSDWQPSGLALAVEQADIYLVIAHWNAHSIFFGFHPPSLLEYIKPLPWRETKSETNGNRPGAYARGRVLPFRGAEGAALVKFCLAIPS